MSDNVFVVLLIELRAYGYFDRTSIVGVRSTKSKAQKLRADYALKHDLIDVSEYDNAVRYSRVDYSVGEYGDYIRIEKYSLTSDGKCV